MIGEPLEVEGLTAGYRGIVAVHDVSLTIAAGDCVGIVGANGAGKTSLLRAISGLTQTSPGTRIAIGGRRIDQLAAEKRVVAGIGHVLEGRHVFPTLSVMQNLMLGDLRGGRRNGSTAVLDEVLGWLPELEPMARTTAASLSGGQQQLLAMARALMGRPTVLLLDEPTVGLAPIMVRRIVEIVRGLREQGITILLVEQSPEVVQAVASTVHVLSHGRIVATTAGDDPKLAEISHRAYLS